MYLKWYPNSLQDCSNDGAWRSNPVDVDINVNVISETSNQSITSWSWDGRVYDEDLHLDEDLYLGYSEYPWNPDTHVTEFFVRGEEDIYISVSGEQSTHGMGSATGVFSSELNWLAVDHNILPGGFCRARDADGDLWRGIPIDIYPTRSTFAGCVNPWIIYINVCTVAD